MRRTVPLTIVFLVGVSLIIRYYIPSRPFMTYYRYVLDWLRVLVVFALVLAVGSLLKHHVDKVKRRREGWAYSIVTLVALPVMAGIGILQGMESDTLFMTLFANVQAPMQATMFSLLAFYMASASYRAFRARTWEATLLLVSAFIVMLGVVPFGAALWKGIPVLSSWLAMVPNLASKRGILFGVGLGIAATSLKIILGIERSWLGGGGG